MGQKLQNLEDLISDRLEKSEAARLDIWQIKMISYPEGFVRQAGPKERKDGHDVAEVKEPKDKDQTTLIRKMSNYMSIGVQGFVGRLVRSSCLTLGIVFFFTNVFTISLVDLKLIVQGID